MRRFFPRSKFPINSAAQCLFFFRYAKKNYQMQGHQVMMSDQLRGYQVMVSEEMCGHHVMMSDGMKASSDDVGMNGGVKC